MPVTPPSKRETKVSVKPAVVGFAVTDHDFSINVAQKGFVEERLAVPIRLRPLGKFRQQHKPLKPTTLNTPSSVTEQPDINVKTKRIVEAILFVAKRPMTAKQVLHVFPELEQPDLQEIQSAIAAITEEYKSRPIELKQVASGYRFQIKQDLSRWVSRLFEEKPPKYSRALLETLAIIAYRQPVTRADIEDIRGVSVSSSIIQTLLEREWVRVVAYKETPGRPGLYGTTKQFLDYFNITSLNELPTLQDIQHLDESIDNTQQPMQVTSEKQETNQRFIEAAGQLAEDNKKVTQTTA